MALEFIDGFDHYTDGANHQRKWDPSSSGSNAATTGRFGGNAWGYQFQDLVLTSAQLSAVATRVVGWAWKYSPTATSNAIFIFRDGANTQVDLRFSSSGVFTVTRNGTSLGTGTTMLSSGTWYYLEIKATIHSSAGSVVFRVNGSNDINLSGINTQATANATMDGLRFANPSGNYGVYLDDVYVLNTSGATNNNFLGECRVFTTLPYADSASAGTNTQWTPNSGTTHSTQVDETSPNDDTDYVLSATAGQIDTYKYPSISPAGTIICVQEVICDRKDDVGSRVICAEYRAGSTNYAGATNFSPQSSYVMHRQIWETDPATSAAWSTSGVNNGEFGVKVIS